MEASRFPGTRLPPGDRLHLLYLGLASGVFLFLLRAAEISGMSSGAGSDVAKERWYFFAHHLLYQPLVRIFALTLEPVGCGIICAGQVHSILWALVAIGSVFLIIRFLGGSRFAAYAGAILLLVANGFWIYSTQLEVYVPVVAMNALIVAVILSRDGKPLTGGALALVMAIFTFSLFFHQANVFFLIPIGIYLLVTEGRQGFWTAVKITAISGVVALGMNMAIFWLTKPGAGLRDFVLWLNYYGAISDDVHGSWDTLFVDLDRFRGAIRSMTIAAISTHEGMLQKPLRLAVMAIMAGTVAWNVLQVVRRGPHARARLLLLLWAGTFFVFFWWWQPYPWKFFLTALAPLVILVALTATDLVRHPALTALPRWAPGAIGASVIVLLGLVNLQNSILPLSKVDGGVRAFSGKIAAAAPAECMIYSERRFTSALHLYHQRKSRPFELLFQKYHYSKVDPDVADAIPESMDLKEDFCAVLPLYWLTSQDYYSPAKNTRGMRKIAGSQETESERPTWEQYLEWILDVQPTGDPGAITHDAMEIFQAGGEPFVRIDRTKREQAESLQSVMDEISGAHAVAGARRLGGEAYDVMADFMMKSFSYF